jgi:ABC-2 type transport system permease protein
MRYIWIVARHEIFATIRRRSFWIMSFVFPALMIGFSLFSGLEEDALNFGGGEAAAAEVRLPVVGIVDRSGLINQIPAGVPEGVFRPLADEAAAREALAAGTIDQYVVVPADFLEKGQLILYDENVTMIGAGSEHNLAAGGNLWMLGQLIAANLAGSDELAAAIQFPVPRTPESEVALRPPEETAAPEAEATARLVGQAVLYAFYFVLIIGNGFMLQSVTAEKENRTAEVLLVSVSSRQLMIGKVLGLSAVVLLQLVIWLGGAWLAFGRGASALNLAAFDIAPGIVVWAVLFLLLGFLLYGSIMAAGGALVPSAREGGQLNIVLILPLLVVLMMATELLENPNSTLSLVLCLVPFTAPAAVVTRMVVTEVPLWQTLLSLAILAVSAYAFMLLAARFFRAGNLLSQTAFSWRRLATGWRD